MRARPRSFRILTLIPVTMALVTPFLAASESPEVPSPFRERIEEINQEFSQELQRILSERDAAIEQVLREAFQEKIAALEARLSEKDCTIASLQARQQGESPTRDDEEASADELPRKIPPSEEAIAHSASPVEAIEPAPAPVLPEVVSPRPTDFVTRPEVETSEKPEVALEKPAIPREEAAPAKPVEPTSPVEETPAVVTRPEPAIEKAGEARPEPVSAKENPEKGIESEPRPAVAPSTEAVEEVKEPAPADTDPGSTGESAPIPEAPEAATSTETAPAPEVENSPEVETSTEEKAEVLTPVAELLTPPGEES